MITRVVFLAALLCAGTAVAVTMPLIYPHAIDSQGESLGKCYRFNYPTGATVTECTYRVTSFSPLSDDLRTAAGISLMAGPWATENDIIHPALRALAGKRPVAINIEMRGMGFVVNAGQEGGLFANVRVNMTAGDANPEVQR